MKPLLATVISTGAVLAAGAVAFAVNTSVLDATVTADQMPAGSAMLVATPTVPDPATGPDLAPSESNPTVGTEGATATTVPVAMSAYDVQGLGIVVLEQAGAALTVVSVSPASGTSSDVVQESATRVEVRFTDPSGQSVKFHADVIGGRIVTTVLREPVAGQRGDGRRRGDDDDHHDGEDRHDDHDDHEDDDD